MTEERLREIEHEIDGDLLEIRVRFGPGWTLRTIDGVNELLAGIREYRALLERVGHKIGCASQFRDWHGDDWCYGECDCIRREIQANLGKEGDHAA